ncbi:MAG: flagellar export protein FliJ [Beijerinckiaceae bacterium]|jgi:flagellar protein FliJ|nr:flagellar export protein FliJ [Beijerinckiaceae bacterium]MDO9439553.1 flagellar export protein FliJ [Beijerinckiaceae bacterium]
MKSRDTLIRLKRFQVEEKRRRVSQIEAMIAEFTRMATDLDREIAAEENRTGMTDPAHFAYSTYARAARSRRDNLHQSTGELRGQLEEARGLLGDATSELAKVQSLDVRDKAADLVRDRSDNLGALRTARA